MGISDFTFLILWIKVIHEQASHIVCVRIMLAILGSPRLHLLLLPNSVSAEVFACSAEA